MIRQFKIICRDENGKSLHEVSIVYNGKLILKGKGNTEEILQQLFAFLINSPQRFDYDFNVTGSKENVEAYKTMLNEWKLMQKGISSEPVLTQRQLDCVRLLQEGKTEREISDDLNIGYEWARKLCCKIYRAYRCHSKGELLSILMNKNGLH